MHLVKTALHHLTAAISLLWVTVNLIFGLLALLPVSIILLVYPNAAITVGLQQIIDKVYRFAVRVDSFWIKRVLGIEIIVKGERISHPAPVVICNHQSWFDILLLQDLITHDGPIVRFLIKRELIWVPIVGWICLALNFPRLYRSKNADNRKSDFTVIEKASKTHNKDSGALLIFPEGTRLTRHKLQRSPYQHVLVPRSGGLNVIKQHTVAGTPLIDVTINYGESGGHFWRCLAGIPKTITIHLEHYTLSDISDTNQWLHSRWQAKDKILSPDC